MSTFRTAVESGDHAAITALLADDVRFTSPVAFRPYEGKPITAAILRAVIRVFEDFRYVREIADPAGRDEALLFTARIGDVTVDGCDFLHFDDEGRIDDFMVMVRPLSAAKALAEAMAGEFGRIGEEAAAGSGRPGA